MQLGCGPSYPMYASGSKGPLSSLNGAYNEFNYCNGVLEVDVDGNTAGGCGGANNVADVEALRYVIV